VGFEHGVELADVGPIALAARRAVLVQVDLVGAEAGVAIAAPYERIGEVLQVAGRFQDSRRREDAAVLADHVLALLDEITPPRLFDVVAERDADRSEIP